MKTKINGIALGLLVLGSISANATTLTFDEFNGTGTSYVGTYESNGFRISGGNISGIGSVYDSVFATGALFDNTGGAVINLRRVDGGAFSLNSIDLTRFPGYDSSAPINMIAYDASDIQIDSFNFVLPNATMFDTYEIGFTNVNRVSWTQAFAYHAFDNIVMDSSSVPEPASLALLGLGLAGLGAMRRRQKSA